MTTVCVTEAMSCVVVFSEEESGEGAVGGVFAKELVDGAQETLRLIESNGALAAEIGLKIGHQKSGGNAFSGNVADDEPKALTAQVKKIVIVAADFPGLMANPRIFEGAERRKSLREKPCLNLFGDFQFLGGAALGFEFGGGGAALGFDSVSDFVEADERERIAVRVLEAGEDAAPDGGMIGRGGIRRLLGVRADLVLEALEARGKLELHAALAPFAEFGDDVFGDEGDVGGMADELESFGVRLRSNQSEVGRAIRRGDRDPPAAGFDAGVKDNVEVKLSEIERKATVQVANVNGDRLEAQVGVLAVEAHSEFVCPSGRGAGHGSIISRVATGNC